MEGQRENHREFRSEREEHQSYLDDHNHCCLCGSKLDFQHKVDYLNLQVKEEADCPQCKICLKSREHKLQ